MAIPQIVAVDDRGTREHPRNPCFVIGVRSKAVSDGRVGGRGPLGGSGLVEIVGRDPVDDASERGIGREEQLIGFHEGRLVLPSDVRGRFPDTDGVHCGMCIHDARRSTRELCGTLSDVGSRCQHSSMDSNPAADRARSRGPAEVRGRLFDAIAETERRIARLQARQAQLIDAVRVLGEADSVASSGPRGWDPVVVARRELSSELACVLRVPERTAENLVERSRTLLHRLPATFASFSAGRIGARHVQVVVEHAWVLPADALPVFEEMILPHAETSTVATFERRARVVRERMHPESLTTRAAAARDSREVRFQAGRDKMAWLNSYLPAETALAAFNRVTQIAASLRDGAEERTLAQLRADVLGDLLITGVTDSPEDAVVSPEARHDLDVLRTMIGDIEDLTGQTLSIQEMARLSSPDPMSGAGVSNPALWSPTVPRGTGRGIRAEVLVTVPVLSLLGRSDEPATLDGYGPIDPDTARRLASAAPSFHRILTHPENGAVLSVGRDAYTVPRDLRRWLRVRDGTCRHPGCNRATAGCDIDHTLDWQHAGATDHCNLAHLCPAHHHLKHHTRWSVSQRPDGTLDWISPTGHPYPTEPDIVLSAPMPARGPTFG